MPVLKSQAQTATVMSTPAAAADEPPFLQIPFPPQDYVIPPSYGTGETVSLPVTAVAWQGTYPLKNLSWWLGGPQANVANPVSGTSYTKNVVVPYISGEPLQGILVQVAVHAPPGAQGTSKQRHVKYPDVTPPKNEIISPKDTAQVPLGALVVNGITEDRQSGVAAVEWSLDGSSSYSQALLTIDPQDNRRVNWRFEIPNLRSGPNTITIRSRDQKGHAALSVITVTASGDYKPKDDLASLRAYLEDLIEYAAIHVKFTEEQLPKAEMVAKMAAELTKLFYQPFAKLIDTYDANVLFANQPVNQLRAAIEVLRQYLVAAADSGPGSTLLIAGPGKLMLSRRTQRQRALEPDLILSADQPGSALTLFSPSMVSEADYRLEAYQALLGRNRHFLRGDPAGPRRRRGNTPGAGRSFRHSARSRNQSTGKVVPVRIGDDGDESGGSLWPGRHNPRPADECSGTRPAGVAARLSGEALARAGRGRILQSRSAAADHRPRPDRKGRSAPG